MDHQFEPLGPDERRAWLAWSTILELGPRSLNRYRAAFGSLAAAWSAPITTFRELGASAIQCQAIEQARSAFDPSAFSARLEESRIRAIALPDPNYPPLLRELADPPFILYVRGEVPSGRLFSIVGTRTPTTYGRLMAERLTQAAARCGLGIVSGLALGIDGVAHENALNAQARTFAVFASGLDRVYPATHEALGQRILQQGGWVSEYPPGTEPLRFHFPRRNRIIAGLSFGTLVVEAGASSGALITARLALDANREVFAVPGPATSALSTGPHALLRQGAQLIASENDLFEALQALPTSEGTQTPKTLSTEAACLLSLLAKEPCNVDQLIERSRMTSGRVLGLCAELELQGRIRRLDDATYVVLG